MKMKWKAGLLALGALGLLVTTTLHARSIAKLRVGAKVGLMAPNFTLTDTKGKKHSLYQYKGKYIVLEWLNHGCPFVRKHYDSGNMQKLQKEFAKKGVVWLSIVSSAPGKQGYHTPKEADAITKKKGAAPAAVLLDPDGKVGRKFKARVTPHMYVLNPAGTLIYIGAIDSIRSADTDDIKKATNYVAQSLNQAMKGKPVTVKTSRPYGCSVKYK